MSLAARIAPEFPLPGSEAWLRPEPGRPEALPIRIIQRDRRDGSFYVAQRGTVYPHEAASAHRRVALAEIFATEEEAIGEVCKPCKGTGQRRRTRKGALALSTCPRCDGAGRVFPNAAQ